jgi:hypothetical protein
MPFGQIHFLRRWLEKIGSSESEPGLNPLEMRRLLMMDLSLWGRLPSLPHTIDDSRSRLARNPTLRGELLELLAHRLGSIDSVAPGLELPFDCPLTLHAPYTRDEIMAGLGHWTRQAQREMREGVLHLPDLPADVFLFTLHKTEAHYSPTTMYQDYAISDRLFHWQSQSTTSADSPTGRRYIEHEARDHTILLFGREHRNRNGLAEPFVFLGPARYQGHAGSRPMSVTWELIHPLPARLYRILARLAVA